MWQLKVSPMIRPVVKGGQGNRGANVQGRGV